MLPACAWLTLASTPRTTSSVTHGGAFLTSQQLTRKSTACARNDTNDATPTAKKMRNIGKSSSKWWLNHDASWRQNQPTFQNVTMYCLDNWTTSCEETILRK